MNGAVVVFVSLANKVFLDLVPNIPDTLGDNDFRSQILYAHALYEVQIVDDTLHLVELSFRFIYNQLAENKSLISHTSIAGGLSLTVSTKDHNQFIIEHMQEPGFFEDIILLNRKSKRPRDENGAALLSTKPFERYYSQPCIP